MTDKPKILVIEARFYDELADELAAGAIEVLEKANAEITRVAVPGVLEIPSALAMALIAEDEGDGESYDGFVVLGVVIRGETTHYDIVANESARAIMIICTSEGLALGNGIQTVENQEQAWARANRSEKNKGGGAAQAALAMIALKAKLGL